MIQIIPAVLATKVTDFERDIFRYQRSQLFKNGWVHIDFIDNIFVPNKSIGVPDLAKYPINLHKEAHLMVVRPEEWIDGLVEAGFERAIFHIEAEDGEVIEYIKGKDLEVGIAVNPTTPIRSLEPFMAKIDTVLIMGVVPGFQRQPFIPETLNRIKEVSRLRSKGNYSFRIGVDGAVKDDNIKEIVRVGADFVVVGSYLLNGDIDENLERLWEGVSGA